jgi:hypothetical protein
VIGNKGGARITLLRLQNIIKDITTYYNLLKDYLNVEVQPKDTSKGHFYVSLAKSLIRIVAGVCLVNGNFVFAGTGFIIAEVLGIVEEMV